MHERTPRCCERPEIGAIVDLVRRQPWLSPCRAMHATRTPRIATVSTGLLGSPYGVLVGLRVNTSSPSCSNPLPTINASSVTLHRPATA